MREKVKIKGDDLQMKNYYGYSIGHIINDINCTLLFNYLLYFLTNIVHLSNTQAGTVSLIGQVFDAIQSMMVGFLVDKYEIANLGKKTTWYLLGNILNSVGIIFFFQGSPFRTESSIDSDTSTLDFLYYTFILIVFSSGYSLLNISHMSMLPSLSINRKSKDFMVRLRTGFRFIAQLLAVFISSVLFYFITDKFTSYRYITILCVIIGLTSSICFLILCRETELTKNIPEYYKNFQILLKSKLPIASHTAEEIEIKEIGENTNEETTEFISEANKYNTDKDKMIMDMTNVKIHTLTNQREQPIQQNNQIDKPIDKQTNQPITIEENTYYFWLTNALFYKYIIAYIVIHIAINFSLSLMPYYLTMILNIRQTELGGTPVRIALFFLINTSGSIFSSLFIQEWVETFNSRFSLYFFAWLCLTLGCFPMILLDPDYINVIYLLSFILGIGYSLAINVANIVVNDVVGNKGNKGGGFVFSTFGFLERVLNGILILTCMAYVKDDYILMRYFFPLFPICLLFIGMLIVKHEENSRNNYEKTFEDHEMHELLLDHPYYTFTSPLNSHYGQSAERAQNSRRSTEKDRELKDREKENQINNENN